MSKTTKTKATKTKAAKAKVTKGARAKLVACTAPAKTTAPGNEHISAHLPALKRALASRDGATVQALRTELGICPKSVRKLLAQTGAVKGEGGTYRNA